MVFSPSVQLSLDFCLLDRADVTHYLNSALSIILLCQDTSLCIITYASGYSRIWDHEPLFFQVQVNTTPFAILAAIKMCTLF